MAWAGSRCEIIENVVKDLFNDDSGQFYSQTQLIRWLNACQRDIARRGYWKKETSFNAVAATSSYVLSSSITDFVELYDMRWTDDDYNLVRCQSWAQYRELADGFGTETGIPLYWFEQGGRVYVTPTPSSNTTNGFIAYHAYLPTAFDSSTNTTPNTPASYDDLYVYYCLFTLNQRDKTNPQRQTDAQSYKNLYDDMLADLIEQGRNKNIGLIPYR